MEAFVSAVTGPAGAWIAGTLVKVTIVLAGAAVLAAALRRTSAAARHFVWGAGLLGVLLVPIGAVVLRWEVPVLPAPAPVPAIAADAASPATLEPAAPPARAAEPRGAEAPAPVEAREERRAAGTPAVPERAPLPVPFIVLGLWVAGAVLIAGRLGLGAMLVRRTRRHARPLDGTEWTRPLYEAADRLALPEVPELLLSDDTPMPFACGLVRPAIVLPREAEEWSDRRRRAVLSHELAHLRRLDLPLNALGQLACALYWFHPLVWVAQRRLRLESERACDDLVIGIGTRPSEYADHLLQIVCRAARAETPAIALPLAQRNEFEGRMLAILEAGIPRGAPTRRRAAGLSLAALALIVPLTIMQPTNRAAPAAQTTIELPPVTAQLPDDEVGDAPASDVAPAEARTAATEVEPTTGPAAAASDASSPVARTPAVAGQDTTPRVIVALIAALRDSVAEVRESAAYALGQREAREAVTALIAVAGRDPDADVREIAVWSLVQIEAIEAGQVLARALVQDDDADVREMAGWGLGQIEPPGVVEALSAAFRDSVADVREVAAWALGQIEPRPAPAALIAGLRDPDADVREMSAWALGQIEDPETATPLLAAISSETNGDAKELMVWAVARLDSEIAQDALVALLRDDDPEVRAAAARALSGRGGNPSPRPRPRPIIR